jgi:hypothetical protein
MNYKPKPQPPRKAFSGPTDGNRHNFASFAAVPSPLILRAIAGIVFFLGPEIFSLQARTGNAASHFPIGMAQKETDLIPKLNRMPDC